ncbi:hypothetical protein KC19_9G018400 [Ceratodon purpureus]|uniref:Uncharacterized protein n=1 Tax=Ceratodon purpureus TaxID=3225 RepID=A0A8T0GMT0_CERPU|nr:hypothetical protein KC19_9G018400 [Ceratodon purpureus]
MEKVISLFASLYLLWSESWGHGPHLHYHCCNFAHVPFESNLLIFVFPVISNSI